MSYPTLHRSSGRSPARSAHPRPNGQLDSMDFCALSDWRCPCPNGRRVAELEAQLDSGKPSEAAMFNIARDQAKRDAETDKLRSQIKSLRQMLKESHRVLTHLMQQEGLLKEELANTRRDLERQARRMPTSCLSLHPWERASLDSLLRVKVDMTRPADTRRPCLTGRTQRCVP